MLVFVCVFLRTYLVGRQWVGRGWAVRFVCAPRWHRSGALTVMYYIRIDLRQRGVWGALTTNVGTRPSTAKYAVVAWKRASCRIGTHLSLAQLAERETVVFTAISRSSVRLREGRLFWFRFWFWSKLGPFFLERFWLVGFWLVFGFGLGFGFGFGFG